MKKLIIATRQSLLALRQAELVKVALEQQYPDLSVELLGMTTEGDRLLDKRLSSIGGKGLFVKELEKALLDGRADIAVHSVKDLPTEWPEGLMLSAICERDDPHDVLVSSKFKTVADLPPHAVVGTASLRRHCQLQALRPDLNIQPLRGNIHTRLQRLDEGYYHAIVLAAAGLLRMNMGARISSYLDMLPAIGQGALGIECRTEDKETQALVTALDHLPTRVCVTAERAMSQMLGGGCHVPMGGYATLENETLTLEGMVWQLDGCKILHSRIKGPAENAEALGIALAEDLLSQGARAILDASQPSVISGPPEV